MCIPPFARAWCTLSAQEPLFPVGTHAPAAQQEAPQVAAAPRARASRTGKPLRARSSRFRGVTKHRRSGRWEAHCWVQQLGRQVYLGVDLSVAWHVSIHA